MSYRIEKYTVRNVSEEWINRLREIRATSGVPIGRLLDEAIEYWWESLPFENEV